MSVEIVKQHFNTEQKPILKVYFIDNEYLSTCNICIYNIPKKEFKNGACQYDFNFPKHEIGNEKCTVNASIYIPEAMFDNFVRYGIMQKDKLSYCEVIQNRETTFSLIIWLYDCELKVTGKRIRIEEDKMLLSACVKKHKKKNRKLHCANKHKNKNKKSHRKVLFHILCKVQMMV